MPSSNKSLPLISQICSSIINGSKVLWNFGFARATQVSIRVDGLSVRRLGVLAPWVT